MSMTAIFICQIVFGISVVGMLFIFLRTLPVLVEFEPTPVSKKETVPFKLKNKYNNFQKQVKEKFNHWQEKNLHKVRLWILKLDNSLTTQLEKIRKQKIHFSRKERQKKEKNTKK